MKNNKKWKNNYLKYRSIDSKMVNLVWNYFKKNNLGIYDYWKHQLAAYRLWLVMDKIYDYNSKELLENFYFIVNDLKNIKKSLIILHNFVKDENDNRPGIETYGYESKESIISNLKYISDRWSCQFRLRWLLDLTELDLNNSSLKGEVSLLN